MGPILSVLSLFIISVHCQETTQTPKPLRVDEPVIYPEDYCQHFDDKHKFDFVVVGSGPGGGVVARRLAEIEENEVLLLEAGGDPPPSSDLAVNSLHLPDEDLWQFGTDPSSGECRGFKGNSCPLQVAKVLGGSSVVNLMMHVRGNHQDFDDIEKLGNPGWGYKNIAHYYKKMENYVAGPIEDDEEDSDENRSEIDSWEKEKHLREVQITTPFPDIDASCPEPDSSSEGSEQREEEYNQYPKYQRPPVSSKYHSRGGPQKNGQFPFDPYSNGIRKGMEKAFELAGIKYNPDYNGKSQIGYTRLTGSIDEIGYRYNIAKGYLTKIPNNLKVCKYSLVTRILLKGKEVAGVEFIHNNGNVTKKMYAKAEKEYIISAGPYNTPALLERSGIGRKDVLRKVKVQPLHILPGVGENMMDHYLTLSSSFKINPNTAASPNPLSLSISELGAFLNLTDPSSEVPEIQYLFTFFKGRNSSAFQNIRESLSNQFKEAGTVLEACALVLREKTPGSTHISQTKDPTKTPIIKQKAYENREEVKEIVRAINYIRKILLSPPMKEFGIELFVFKQCQKYPINSEKEILCGCKLLTRSVYHASGTCKMGPKTDKMSVVDERLRVHGLKKLRIIDSSIFPLIPRGNTQVPTMVVSEKGADMIKEDYGQL